jgi:hypothetical protein
MRGLQPYLKHDTTDQIWIHAYKAGYTGSVTRDNQPLLTFNFAGWSVVGNTLISLHGLGEIAINGHREMLTSEWDLGTSSIMSCCCHDDSRNRFDDNDHKTRHSDR